MLSVPQLAVLSKDCPLEQLGGYLDALKPRLGLPYQYFAADSDRSYKPNVEFVIGHDVENLIAKFWVAEACARAANEADDSPVYEDSCVEIFLTTDETPETYYNFEFNCIGACLAHTGPSLQDRRPLTEDKMRLIRRWTSLPRLPFTERKAQTLPSASETIKSNNNSNWITWEIIVVLPRSVFGVFRPSLTGLTIKGNVYKCGDKLSLPHWLSFFPIETDRPAFHRPEAFGPFELQIAKSVLDGVPDNPIAQMKAKLHKQREVNKPIVLDSTREEILERSRLLADAKLGKVKNDSPELLNALLKWYQSDVEQKTRVLDDFFASLHGEDLVALKAALTGEALSLPPTSSFVLKALQWKGLAASHGSLFLSRLDRAIANLNAPTKFDKEALYFALVNEISALLQDHDDSRT